MFTLKINQKEHLEIKADIYNKNSIKFCGFLFDSGIYTQKQNKILEFSSSGKYFQNNHRQKIIFKTIIVRKSFSIQSSSENYFQSNYR